MATTDISICAAALLELGDQPIASFTEATQRATLCANLYPAERLDMLRAHPWNCAKKRTVLSPLSEAPAFEWGYQFALPGDLLRILQVGYDGQPEDYIVENGRILARSNVLRLVYVADINEGGWDAALVRAMTKRMAAVLAYPITKSASLAQEKVSEAELAFKRAKAVDGQEEPPESWDDSSLLAARFGAVR